MVTGAHERPAARSRRRSILWAIAITIAAIGAIIIVPMLVAALFDGTFEIRQIGPAPLT